MEYIVLVMLQIAIIYMGTFSPYIFCRQENWRILKVSAVGSNHVPQLQVLQLRTTGLPSLQKEFQYII